MFKFGVGHLLNDSIVRKVVPSLQEAIDHVRSLSPGKDPYGIWDSQGLPVAIVYDGFVFDLRKEFVGDD